LEKYICIHGHFYQPPRENAWLEVIEVQDSAHPYHDWNERISAECYAPNTASRILNEKSVIKNIISNYTKISFNFGPTLLSWMEGHDPETYQAILQADVESVKNFNGHGSAMAQVYNHMIMPLANARDKETQIIWGIADFESRFKRKPEGMWLSETAVDVESLELLAKHGIKFTVLAPRQAKAFRLKGSAAWTTVNTETLDTRRPYLYNLKSGKTIALFFYDGDISQGVAFDGLLNDGKKFAHRLLDGFDNQSVEPQLVHIATDGETYGHHHKHGDMALAYALDYIERHNHSHLTNYAEFLSKFPPTYEVEIHESSSWSCVHGVERWRDNCGCNSGKPNWHQLWRKPLRETLDWLRDELISIYVKETSNFLKDPWRAREEYIHVILNRSEENITKFLKEHCFIEVEHNRVLRMMEVQRNAMLMYTSCGWFFDDLSGIETTQIMQYACRAMQLVSQVSEIRLEEEFLKRIELAPSNVPSLGNGKEVYRKYVIPSKTNLQRVGMHYAVASIFEEDPESFPVFNYTTQNEIFIRKEAGEQKLVIGITRVKSNVTRSEQKFTFAVIYMGQHNIIGNISIDMALEKFNVMQSLIVKAFDEARLGDIIGLMQMYFGPDKYTIWQLFQDEKRKVFDLITYQSMRDLENSLRRIYNRDYPLVMALANNDAPIPNAYKTTFEYILNADLTRSFLLERLNIRQIERIANELVKWRLNIEDADRLERLVGETIIRELKRFTQEGDNYLRIERLNRLFPLLSKLNLTPNLYKSQNLYFEISKANPTYEGHSPEWIREFTLLGENLRVKIELSPIGD
jgi:alpha-amylase/alpha-mannosidase (GH57 family)